MTTTETRRPASLAPTPMKAAPVGAPSSPQSIALAIPIPPPTEGNPATRTASDDADPNHPSPSGSPSALLDHRCSDTHTSNVEQGASSPRPPIVVAEPIHHASGGDPSTTTGHVRDDTHNEIAGGGPSTQQAEDLPEPRVAVPAGSDSPPDQKAADSQPSGVGRGSSSGQAARASAQSKVVPLLDPTLLIAAEIVDDLEKTRVANANRLRQLTRDTEDTDGEERGFGLTEDHPAVARVAAIVEGLGKLEHEAVLNVQRAMRQHPLGPWVKVQRGIGEKQAARLLAAIGDPYWNTLHDRPRTVSELWAYCGYHVVPAGQSSGESHVAPASGEMGGDTGQVVADAHMIGAGVAPRRTRGQKSNWSEDARKRSWLIVQSVIKAGGPWREVYDARKAATEGKLHETPCIRCGPKGKPAQIGTPWSDGHRHADAIRITAKEILKALWIESRRLHEPPTGGQRRDDAQRHLAAGRAPSEGGAS